MREWDERAKAEREGSDREGEWQCLQKSEAMLRGLQGCVCFTCRLERRKMDASVGLAPPPTPGSLMQCGVSSIPVRD